ncbi:uncharacterized protein VTP21DRAFT_6058 [Calcarisporiella thermophila]|uniref:uncharacterized protein n=1 Tax=Calcarisporiella thermophila TaxID=911321 RepID=UPI0037431DE1
MLYTPATAAAPAHLHYHLLQGSNGSKPHPVDSLWFHERPAATAAPSASAAPPRSPHPMHNSRRPPSPPFPPYAPHPMGPAASYRVPLDAPHKVAGGGEEEGEGEGERGARRGECHAPAGHSASGHLHAGFSPQPGGAPLYYAAATPSLDGFSTVSSTPSPAPFYVEQPPMYPVHPHALDAAFFHPMAQPAAAPVFFSPPPGVGYATLEHESEVEEIGSSLGSPLPPSSHPTPYLAWELATQPEFRPHATPPESARLSVPAASPTPPHPPPPPHPYGADEPFSLVDYASPAVSAPQFRTAILSPPPLPTPLPPASLTTVPPTLPSSHPAFSPLPHASAQPQGSFRGAVMKENAVDRPYKCESCSQSFHRNHDLKRHARIHLQVKPFACQHCHKSFSRKDALKRHTVVKKCGMNSAAESGKRPPPGPSSATGAAGKIGDDPAP